jgi:lactoylglutathione lyase
VNLAKDCLDVGLYTDRYEDVRAFYCDRLGLPYEELLKVGSGVHQHRLGLHGGVLKVNSSRQALAEAPTNLIGLDLPAPVTDLQRLTDPDGTSVALVPGDSLTVHWASSAPHRLAELLSAGMDAVDGPAGELRIGRTNIVLHPGGVRAGPMRARGLRYLTVQVRDVRSEHARLVALGWSEQVQPVRLGDTAFISFVTDPDGTPVEISQRASLTGPLPPG